MSRGLGPALYQQSCRGKARTGPTFLGALCCRQDEPPGVTHATQRSSIAGSSRKPSPTWPTVESPKAPAATCLSAAPSCPLLPASPLQGPVLRFLSPVSQAPSRKPEPAHFLPPSISHTSLASNRSTCPPEGGHSSLFLLLGKLRSPVPKGWAVLCPGLPHPAPVLPYPGLGNGHFLKRGQRGSAGFSFALSTTREVSQPERGFCDTVRLRDKLGHDHGPSERGAVVHHGKRKASHVSRQLPKYGLRAGQL